MKEQIEKLKELQDLLNIVTLEHPSEGMAKAVLNERTGTFVFIEWDEEELLALMGDGKYQKYEGKGTSVDVDEVYIEK